jgi:hypothetical protein
MFGRQHGYKHHVGSRGYRESGSLVERDPATGFYYNRNRTVESSTQGLDMRPVSLAFGQFDTPPRLLWGITSLKRPQITPVYGDAHNEWRVHNFGESYRLGAWNWEVSDLRDKN